MKKRWSKIISIVLLLLCMGFIYYNSCQNGYDSNKVSNKILDKVEDKKIVNDAVKGALKKSGNKEVLIRKLAHMFEFFLLAILVSIVLLMFNIRGMGTIIYVLFVILLYAVFDEFHQMYIPGRTSSVKDVLIDFGGGILGVIVFNVGCYIKLKLTKKEAKE